MSLGLAPEHLELVDAVRGWTSRHCDPTVIRAAADGADSGAAVYARELRPALAELGLFGLHLPEADGGQGFGVAELAVAVEQLGRALLPGAFLPTVLASTVLGECGQRSSAALIAKLADGSLTGTVSLAGGLAGEGDIAAGGPDNGLVVSGESYPV